jgi:hypothetical protein
MNLKSQCADNYEILGANLYTFEFVLLQVQDGARITRGKPTNSR